MTTESMERRICIQISHPVEENGSKVKLSPCTPEGSFAYFPSKHEPAFLPLRRLHDKAVQTHIGSYDQAVQSDIRVPWSRWTQMEPQKVKTNDEQLSKIDPDLLRMVDTMTQEAATIDILHNDWGSLSKLDKTHSLLKPLLQAINQRSSRSAAPQFESEDDEEPSEAISIIGLPKLQRLRQRMMAKLHHQRTLASESTTPIQNFLELLDELRNQQSKEENDVAPTENTHVRDYRKHID